MADATEPRSGVREALGLRPIINVSGTMTHLGASIAVPRAIELAGKIMPEFVEISDLHRLASRSIARLTGAEAGFVTASCAAGITLSVAACMTGADLARIEQLPDPAGMKHRVPIMAGHMISFGAPVEQSVRLAGAAVVPFGQATGVKPYQLAAVLDQATAAALYVVSHHCVGYGQLPLEEFAAICRAKGVPVIVDAASEYDLRGFLSKGADLVCYSAHKFLGGPTAGIIAGRKDLVRACYLQNSGIGRGMKVGKESILGTVAALEAWEVRDHAGIRASERAALDLWREKFSAVPGLVAELVPDPTDNPLDRLKLTVQPERAHITAWELADRLAAGDPPVIVRDHEVE
ncbi:MAG: aminotransferase class V-fold PLP-dependent enzyme, partial [Acetobacteraceae bacterium]|nr:aminotransferase class V-fold PLP-dependent enzyme [Acetobacteraceae bacterium]